VDEEDILGLEIAMDDVLGVGCREGACDLAAQPQRLGHRQCAEPGQPAIERLSIEIFHHDERTTIAVVTEIKDLHETRIVDRGHRARLVEEPVDDVRPGTQLW